jgi:hypothetical protein
MQTSVAIVMEKPLNGERERKFATGAELAKWVHENRPDIFAKLKKSEQRD